MIIHATYMCIYMMLYMIYNMICIYIYIYVYTMLIIYIYIYISNDNNDDSNNIDILGLIHCVLGRLGVPHWTYSILGYDAEEVI